MSEVKRNRDRERILAIEALLQHPGYLALMEDCEAECADLLSDMVAEQDEAALVKRARLWQAFSRLHLILSTAPQEMHARLEQERDLYGDVRTDLSENQGED